MSVANAYDKQFYAEIEDGSRRSASVIVPAVLGLMPEVRSVVDFGCGNGVWLAEFQRAGIKTVYGLDFGEGAPESLLIDPTKYRAADLGRPIRVPSFDLCVSLEVAEHLPADAADTFVDNLVRAADFVLFSAAIPGQGGHHHINECPPGFWIDRFQERGLVCLDVIRPAIWNDDRICWWYRQNVMLFIKSSRSDFIGKLEKLPSFQGDFLVHPLLFDQICHQKMPQIAIPSPDENTEVRSDAKESNSHQVDYYRAVTRLKSSVFWKLTRPIHGISGAAKKINKL